MRFEWFVALRYLREGKAQTALILGGTTVGVAVLVFLTALISGLQRTLVAQTLSTQAHVLVKAPERDIAAVPGIGKKKAKLIRAILAYEYEEEDDRTLMC